MSGRNCFLLAWTASLLALSATCSADNHVDDLRYRTYGGFVVSTNAVLPAREVHPSLWFGQTGIAGLRAKRNADGYSMDLWLRMTHDPLLTMPLPEPPRTGADPRIQEYYATMSKLAKLNALMSLVGEETNRAACRLRAVQALQRAYDGPIYEMNPKSDSVEAIWRGTWAQNFAAAYDWVQPSLPPEADRLIRSRLAKEAQFISDNLYVWAPHPHNHLSKPAWGLGTLALTLSDNPRAREWLAAALKASNQNTRYFFSADGIYREGPHYLLFSAINFIPFLYHYRNVSGVDDFPVFQPAFEAIIATRNGKGWLPNLYDSYLKPFPTHMVAAPYMNCRTWLNPDARLGNLLQWNFRNTDFGAFDQAQGQTGFNYTGDSWGYTLDVDEFLTYDPTIQPVGPSVSPTIFLKGGQTVFRNNWAFNTPRTRYLLFQGVALADNHFHHDHLSFIIQAENQMMASDSGYSRHSYGEAIRTQWYITPEAHNVVTADGMAPVDTADNVTPVSRDTLDAPFFAFQEKEAPYPDGALQKRAIAFPGKDYFVVIDQLTAPRRVDYQLNLHGGRGKMESNGNRRVWVYASDPYGPPAKLAAWVLSDGATLRDKEGEITYIKGDYAKFGYVSAAQNAQNATFMQILIPLSASAAVPAVADLSGNSAIAATVDKDGVSDTFVARRRHGQTEAGNVRMDGRFAWIRAGGGKVREWAMQEGRGLNCAGVELFKSSIPITIAGRETPAGFEATINAGTSSYTLDLPEGNHERVKEVTFNGRKISAAIKGKRLSVALSGSGALAVDVAPGD
jgi:Heparinase II/III-like protein